MRKKPKKKTFSFRNSTKFLDQYNRDRSQIEKDLAAISVAVEQRTRDAIQTIVNQRDCLIQQIDEHINQEQNLNKSNRFDENVHQEFSPLHFSDLNTTNWQKIFERFNNVMKMHSSEHLFSLDEQKSIVEIFQWTRHRFLFSTRFFTGHQSTSTQNGFTK